MVILVRVMVRVVDRVRVVRVRVVSVKVVRVRVRFGLGQLALR
jgi:hypothetical protein